MSKIIIMQGLPASGKSEKAKELIKQGNTVRINKDLLRTMLHFDNWTGANEGLTREAARILTKHFLERGRNVIIDDTNLNEKTLQSWVDLAKETGSRIEYQRMDTSMEVCIERDSVREKRVGDSVIVGMALQNGLYPKPQKGIVLCDLDGTLCNIDHRLHYVKGEKKDWKGFFAELINDTPRIEVVDKLMKFEGEGYEIFFVSARPDNYREQTEIWLSECFKGYRPHKTLFMRRENDKRPDTEVKLDLLNNYFKDKTWIHTVIDDRPSVIRMWREQGLNVIDVGNGIEF